MLDPLSELAEHGLPARSPAARISWASERMWDLAEGKLSLEAGGVLWAMVTGWADLASEEERRQYLAMARQINTLRVSLAAERG